MSALEANVFTYLNRHAPQAFKFWTVDASPPPADLLSVCDTLYVLKLLGRMDLLADDVEERFVGLLSRYELAGGIGKGRGKALRVHKTAYVLGVLNLLEAARRPCHRAILRESGWRKDQLLDRRTGHPRWPWYFSHHTWRVGHWIGGIPSIVMSLWRLVPDLAERNRLPAPQIVLDRSDSLIDRETGLIRAYRAHTLQRVFRALYGFRHYPEAGDIGGIAHLHWGNYAAGRLPYKGSTALFDRTWSLLQRRPFIEDEPYCLDFDVVQLARTAIPAGDARSGALRARARNYAEDIADFYDRRLDSDYQLHKLPGGLATLHECALAAEFGQVPELTIAPVDIAKEAHWI